MQPAFGPSSRLQYLRTGKQNVPSPDLAAHALYPAPRIRALVPKPSWTKAQRRFHEPVVIFLRISLLSLITRGKRSPLEKAGCGRERGFRPRRPRRQGACAQSSGAGALGAAGCAVRNPARMRPGCPKGAGEHQREALHPRLWLRECGQRPLADNDIKRVFLQPRKQ